MNFFRSWYFLSFWLISINTLYYFAKNRIFRNWVPNFRIEMHPILSKIGKLLPPIDSKKLPQTLGNLSSVTWKSLNFSEMRVKFHKDKISYRHKGKPKIFQGGSLSPLRFFSTGFLNFGLESHHPALKVKPCTYSSIRRNPQIIHLIIVEFCDH